ncbi:MAG: hypothetical protein HY360_13845 [Verrucomicrobia bacterium]|nr:hypothetical protein [Verrucomicrobiota bacterium]
MMNDKTMTNRSRLEAAIQGVPVTQPVYAVYDWFVKNRPQVDWPRLFALGLGQIYHASLTRHEHPNLRIVETTRPVNGRTRRDVRLITDVGELHEWYLDDWRQEYFIKTPEDYRIMRRAWEGVKIVADETAFIASEKEVADNGVTLGNVGGMGSGRTPLMVLQVDWVGLGQWSLDLADELPAMMELLEFMNELRLEEIRQAVLTPARQIKLWENLSLQTLGPSHYRRHLVPLYSKILAIANAAGKRVLVHYDGQLRVIADQVAKLDFDGIDSFTPPPEGDMTVAEARQQWPDKMLWCHPPLGWYRERETLGRLIKGMARDAGPKRFCLMISEDIPPDWEQTVPQVLMTLREANCE